MQRSARDALALVPLRPDFFDANAALRPARDARRLYRRAALVFTLAPPGRQGNAHVSEAVAGLRHYYRELAKSEGPDAPRMPAICPHIMRRRIAIPHSAAEGKSAAEFAGRRSRAAIEIATLARWAWQEAAPVSQATAPHQRVAAGAGPARR